MLGLSEMRIARSSLLELWTGLERLLLSQWILDNLSSAEAKNARQLREGASIFQKTKLTILSLGRTVIQKGER